MAASPMTPQETHVADFIMGSTGLWEKRLGIEHWQIDHYFLPSYFLEQAIEDEFAITASTEARWNYAQAKIKWYLSSAVRHPDEKLEETLVHELCHVVLAPEQSLHELKLQSILGDVDHDDHDRYQTMFYERQELATEMMTRSILRAWRESRDPHWMIDA